MIYVVQFTFISHSRNPETGSMKEYRHTQTIECPSRDMAHLIANAMPYHNDLNVEPAIKVFTKKGGSTIMDYHTIECLLEDFTNSDGKSKGKPKFVDEREAAE